MIDIAYKQLFSVLAVALTLYAFIPYITKILKSSIRPHVFSWVIWGSTTFVVFLAQLADGGGLGAWPIGLSGLLTLLVALLAFLKRADNSITRVDWAFFITAMASLPLWYFTSEPLWAVVILTTVDTLGFGPTIRKINQAPESESAFFFGLYVIRNIFVLIALEHYSVTTVLFPAVIATACMLVILLILYRRRTALGQT